MATYTMKYLGSVDKYIYSYRATSGVVVYRFQFEVHSLDKVINGKYRMSPELAKKDLDLWMLKNGRDQVYNTFKQVK